jgi:hypothetical protein
MAISKSYRFRIATSLAGLETGNFFVLGLPAPQIAFFNDHSTTRSQAQGGTARLGYNVASVLWPRLSMVEASIIQKMIEAVEATGGEGNGTLYLTLPKTLASGVWIDISGIAKRPDWANLVDPDSEGQSYANVRLDLNDCTIEAEPSTVS